MIPTQKSRRASVADAVWCDDWKEEKVRQDLRRKAYSAVSNSVQVQDVPEKWGLAVSLLVVQLIAPMMFILAKISM